MLSFFNRYFTVNVRQLTVLFCVMRRLMFSKSNDLQHIEAVYRVPLDKAMLFQKKQPFFNIYTVSRE